MVFMTLFGRAISDLLKLQRVEIGAEQLSTIAGTTWKPLSE